MVSLNKEIEWNGFLKHAIDESPDEVCGFLYSDKPLEQDGKWICFILDNVAEDKQNSWIPDKKQVQQVKKKARKLKLIKIGNVHTHILSDNPTLEEMEYNIKPSETDLKFAKRFNDIVRGIMIVNKKAVYGVEFHDMFGRKIEAFVTDFEKGGEK